MATEDEQREQALNKLVEHIINPDEDKLSQMTDIPLNLVEPISGMMMVDDLVRMLETRIKENTKRTSSNKKDRAEAIKEERKPLILLSESWEQAMFKLRRSVNGDGMVRATDLAKEQMATRPYEDKESVTFAKEQ